MYHRSGQWVFRKEKGKEGVYVLQKNTMYGIKEQLEGIEKSGADLYLDGKRVSAAELAGMYCVNEDAVYMPDYILDETGRLTQIRYDKVQKS